MANEIILRYSSTGSTLYFMQMNPSGQIWNGSIYTTLVVGSWAAYDIAMTESPSGSYHYFGSLPLLSGLAPQQANIFIYRQTGGSPAITDTLVGQDTWYWTGSQWFSNENYFRVNGIALLGTVAASPSPTAVTFAGDSGFSAVDNIYTDPPMRLIFVTGNNRGIGRDISAYTGSTKAFQFTNNFPTAPGVGDQFTLLATDGHTS